MCSNVHFVRGFPSCPCLITWGLPSYSIYYIYNIFFWLSHDYHIIVIFPFYIPFQILKKWSPTSHAFPTGRKAPGWRTTRWLRFWRRSTRRSSAWNPRPSSAPPRAAPTWPFGCVDSDLAGGNVESLSMFICFIYIYILYIYNNYIWSCITLVNTYGDSWTVMLVFDTRFKYP